LKGWRGVWEFYEIAGGIIVETWIVAVVEVKI